MKFSKLLSKRDASKLREMRSNLARPIPFSKLPDGAYFTVGTSKEVYQKMGNSHSVSQSTKKDAIFSLRSRVHKVGTPT